MTLGEQLAKTSDSILDLILATKDIERKKELREYLTAILALTGKLVEAKVDRDTEKYKAASKALTSANAAIEEAIDDIKKVAEIIKKLAKAVDFVGKLVDSLA